MKRSFDLVIAIVSLIMFAPIMLVISVLVWVLHGKPVIFQQVRPGLHERPFTIYKFRSMLDLVDENGVSLPVKDRITRFGKFLRATSLDELPELFNVIKGDMSIVGPRPLLTRYLDRYSPEQARRHNVKPGITGLAQISGRNAISWEEKFRLDLLYVDNQSLWLDIRILFATAYYVLLQRGISPEGTISVPEFRGNLDKSPPATS